MPDQELLQQRIADLEAALNQNNDALANTFKLTPVLNNLLGLLLSLDVVTAEIITLRANIATDPKVAIHRLRKELEPWREKLGKKSDDDIVHSKRMLGYWLDAETKARVRALIVTKSIAPIDNEITLATRLGIIGKVAAMLAAIAISSTFWNVQEVAPWVARSMYFTSIPHNFT